MESGKAKILGKAAPKIHKVEMKAAAMKVMKVAVKAKAAPMKVIWHKRCLRLSSAVPYGTHGAGRV